MRHILILAPLLAPHLVGGRYLQVKRSALVTDSKGAAWLPEDCGGADRVWEVAVEVFVHHVFYVSSVLKAGILCMEQSYFHADAHLVV